MPEAVVCYRGDRPVSAVTPNREVQPLGLVGSDW